MIQPSLREQKAQKTKQDVLASAEYLFGKYGVNSVSMRDIASHAHVTTGALYYHFNSKADIIAALKRDRATVLQSMFEKSQKTHNPMLNLYEFLCSLVCFEINQSGFLMSDFRKNHRSVRLPREPGDTSATTYFINMFIQQAQEAGMLDPQWPTDDIGFCILSQVLWGIRYELSVNPAIRDVYPSYIREHLGILIRAYAPGTYEIRDQWFQP